MPIGKDSIKKRVAKAAPASEKTPAERKTEAYSVAEDPKFWEALEITVTKERISTSALQRGCNIGYGRAALMIDFMEELGFVAPVDETRKGRIVYLTPEKLAEYKKNALSPVTTSAPATESPAAREKEAVSAPEAMATPAAEPANEPATAVMANVSPETVRRVIGHPETTPSEHIQIGHKMPDYLL